jgi:hypothetical protein
METFNIMLVLLVLVLLGLLGGISFICGIFDTSDSDSKPISLGVGLGLMFIVFMCSLGIREGKQMAYREAITNGVATYEQIIDKDGTVSNKFVWKK